MTQPDPLFLHRFAEIESDRPGFRKYAGFTRKVVVSGTLLGISSADSLPPAGAYGEVAIGHTIFYRGRDFVVTDEKEGTSVLYLPSDMNLPAELLETSTPALTEESNMVGEQDGEGGPPMHERRQYQITSLFHEVASDRPGYRKYVGKTIGLTLHGTFVGEVPDDASPPAGAYSGIALRSSVLYFARDFTYSGKDGDSVLYVLNGRALSPALLQR